MTTLKLVPLDDAVIFPGMPVSLPAKMVGERRVLLVPSPNGAYARVGVVAEAESLPRNNRGNVTLMPLHRGVPSVAHADGDGVLRVDVEERPDVAPPPAMTRELEREYRAVVEEILELRGDDGRV